MAEIPKQWVVTFEGKPYGWMATDNGLERRIEAYGQTPAGALLRAITAWKYDHIEPRHYAQGLLKILRRRRDVEYRMSQRLEMSVKSIRRTLQQENVNLDTVNTIARAAEVTDADLAMAARDEVRNEVQREV